jgi:hypothetical protein
MVQEVTEAALVRLVNRVWIRTPAVTITCWKGKRKFYQRLTLGNRFPLWNETENKVVAGEWAFLAEGGVPFEGPIPSIVGAASLYLGAPYLWGGKTLWGIDCSGLTQMAAAMAGYMIPRDAWQQAETGVAVEFGSHRPGDLAFFANDSGRITHTGILLEGGFIRHAHGFVKDDRCTDSGIINVDNNVLTHRLSKIRRIS